MAARLKNTLIRLITSASARLGLPRRFAPDRRAILLVSTTGVGDTLWSVPAMRAVRETYPRAFIGLLTTPTGAEMLRGNPYIDETYVFRRGASGVLGIVGLLMAMRTRRYGTAVVFHASDRVVWPLVFFAGPMEIVGPDKETKGMDFLLTRQLPHPSDKHYIEARLALVREIGAETSERRINLFLDRSDMDAAGDFLGSCGIPQGARIVGLHPGAKDAYKCWPAQRFAELGRRIRQELGAHVVVTGGPGEEELAGRVAREVDGAASAAGMLGIRATAALISKLDAFVTNDTGPMHLAFAVGTPTVALFCPTDPKQCGPLDAERVAVIYKEPACVPCRDKWCGDARCMRQIEVEEVFETLLGIIGGHD